jgi:uncharacterized protein YbcI
MSSQSEQASAITTAIVSLFREYYGRGPIKAKTFILDDYVLTVLHETLTTAERTLVDDGKETQVREFRLAFQKTMTEQFEGRVAEITGRKVLTYQSQIAFNPEVCFEFFWLEPAAGEAAASAG